jgi:hypothetical protein
LRTDDKGRWIVAILEKKMGRAKIRDEGLVRGKEEVNQCDGKGADY